MTDFRKGKGYMSAKDIRPESNKIVNNMVVGIRSHAGRSQYKSNSS